MIADMARFCSTLPRAASRARVVHASILGNVPARSKVVAVAAPWFVDAPSAQALLRHTCVRWAANVSRDRLSVAWQHARAQLRRIPPDAAVAGTRLPVAAAIAASYQRQASATAPRSCWSGCGRPFAGERALVTTRDAPWEETGRLVRRFHRAGLDHADLNAHNILFDAGGKGWLIDFDRGRLRIPETRWRRDNLARLRRSLLKLRGARDAGDVERDYARLHAAYDATWERGY